MQFSCLPPRRGGNSSTRWPLLWIFRARCPRDECCHYRNHCFPPPGGWAGGLFPYKFPWGILGSPSGGWSRINRRMLLDAFESAVHPQTIPWNSPVIPEYHAPHPHRNVHNPCHNVAIKSRIKMGILSHAGPRVRPSLWGGVIAGGILRGGTPSPFKPGAELVMEACPGLKATGVRFQIVCEQDIALDWLQFPPLFWCNVITFQTTVKVRHQGSLDWSWFFPPFLGRCCSHQIRGCSRVRCGLGCICQYLFSYDLGKSYWNAIPDSIHLHHFSAIKTIQIWSRRLLLGTKHCTSIKFNDDFALTMYPPSQTLLWIGLNW